ncbi:hypothetical protein GCM10007424_16950 [Flavobacterium suaedae]|uniref:O-antigen ligase-related domain-containing protein n=1 Tax=Flavobacterium suaedae TaxID=1767027 RepID=A0ABQ1JYE1_9FLAO|nr:O-antigen ligase family protein [Flavobacterium suaedae]GGB77497.1 hypothetical protein GCM10007424_16950 [Flavobacterium suaedae]
MKKIIDNSYDYIFALLLLGLPFSKALPNILLPILGLFFIITYKEVNFKKLLKTPIVILYAFLFFIFIKATINQTIIAESSYFKKYIILLFIPLLSLKVKNFKLIKIASVAIVNITILTSIVFIVMHYLSYGELPFNSGSIVNELLIMERPYAGFFAVLGTVLSLNLIKYYPPYRTALLLSATLAVGFIVIIAARLSLLSLIGILGIYILFYSTLGIGKKVLIVIGSLVFLVFLFIFNSNISERFFIKENLEKSIEVASDYEPRLIIWPCAAGMVNQSSFSWATGFQTNKEIENNLLDCYGTVISNNPSKKEYYLSEKFNTHNQYLDILLSQGIIGLLLFVSFLLLLLKHIKHNFFYVSIIIAFAMFLMVENVFHRQVGCYIFSIFAAFLSMNNYRYNEET